MRVCPQTNQNDAGKRCRQALIQVAQKLKYKAHGNFEDLARSEWKRAGYCRADKRKWKQVSRFR